MKILVADLKKKRPWLDCDNGELVSILKAHREFDVIVKTQLDNDQYAAEIKDSSYDLIVIHVEHQNINQALTAYAALEENQHRIVLYGFGARFNQNLGALKYAVDSNDIHQVIRCVNTALGTSFIYPYGHIVGSDYSELNIRSVYNYPIRYSKGCENSCPYCERSLEKIKEYRSAEDLDAELNTAVNKYSAKAVTFLDASLLGGRGNRFFEDVLPLLNKYHLRWRANGITLASVDEDKISLLRESGCYLLSIGVESFAPGVKTGKKIDHGHLVRTLSALRQNGIYSLGFFICGLEGDTYEKAMASFETVKELNMDIRLYSSAVAMPGTALWNYVNKNGRFLCDIGDVFPDSKTKIHFETDDFSAEERAQFMHHTEILREYNHKASELIRKELGCPWSISEMENIIWKM